MLAGPNFARIIHSSSVVLKVIYILHNNYLYSNFNFLYRIYRHRVYDYQVYPVGMSDMRLIDNRVSTTWCQVRTNSGFLQILLI